jgi:hypothetical protein
MATISPFPKDLIPILKYIKKHPIFCYKDIMKAFKLSYAQAKNRINKTIARAKIDPDISMRLRLTTVAGIRWFIVEYKDN